MMHSRWKIVACLIAIVIVPAILQAEDKEAVPVSRTIKILDEPRTIAPTAVLPEKLTQKVTVEFKEWSLLEFTQWLGKTIEMPVILDKVSLNEAGVNELELVSDNAGDEPIYLLLQRVLASLPNTLTYRIDEDILYITTQAQAEEIQFTETYNLTKYIDTGYTSDAIIDVILKSTTGPWMDIEGVGGTIQILGDIMLVRSTQNIQMEIKAILKGLPKPGKQTFLIMPEKHLEFIDQLDQRVTIDVVNQPLINVVANLAEQTKLPIRLDRSALHESGISFRKPITLKLKNIKLGIILKALITEKPTTWMAQNGVIFITTESVAEEILHTAIYDVRDLCRNQEEADALTEAQMEQTSGPWSDIDGTGGALTFPKPGVMVIRQTMKVHREILDLLTIYRKALLSSKPRNQKKEDADKIITHYYRMRAEMADSLSELLPVLVDPDSWKNGERRIYLVQSKPEIIKINQNKATKKQDQTTGLTVESPQAVLLIKQTKKNHEQINDIIIRVENGDGLFGSNQFGGGGFGGGGGSFGGGQQGGFGGGFFSLPAK